jgi:hypothetical protein
MIDLTPKIELEVEGMKLIAVKEKRVNHCTGCIAVFNGKLCSRIKNQLDIVEGGTTMDSCSTFKIIFEEVVMEEVIFTEEELEEEELMEEEELGFKSSKEMFEYLLDGGVIKYDKSFLTISEFGNLIDHETKYPIDLTFNKVVLMASQATRYKVPLWYMEEFSPCLCKVGFYPVADLPMKDCKIAVIDRYCTLTKLFWSGTTQQYSYAVPLTQVEVNKYIPRTEIY